MSRQPTADRLWAKVDLAGPDECWPFMGARYPGGYGELSVKGRPAHAHRVAWIVTNGLIVDGLHVLHRCDNPPCCNPAHLFLGTNADNVADREAKGRTRGRTPIYDLPAELRQAHARYRRAQRMGEITQEVKDGAAAYQQALRRARASKTQYPSQVGPQGERNP